MKVYCINYIYIFKNFSWNHILIFFSLGLVDESNELFDLAYGVDAAEDNTNDDVVPEVDLDEEDDEYKPLKPAKRGRKPKSKQATTSVSGGAVNNIKKEDLNDNNTTNNDVEHQNPNAECQCYYCGDMVFYKNIQEHMKSAHGRFHRKMFGAPRPLQCEVCRATFEKQSALTSHSCYTNFIPTKVRGGDPYKCDICKKYLPFFPNFFFVKSQEQYYYSTFTFFRQENIHS